MLNQHRAVILYGTGINEWKISFGTPETKPPAKASRVSICSYTFTALFRNEVQEGHFSLTLDAYPRFAPRLIPVGLAIVLNLKILQRAISTIHLVHRGPYLSGVGGAGAHRTDTHTPFNVDVIVAFTTLEILRGVRPRAAFTPLEEREPVPKGRGTEFRSFILFVSRTTPGAGTRHARRSSALRDRDFSDPRRPRAGAVAGGRGGRRRVGLRAGLPCRRAGVAPRLALVRDRSLPGDSSVTVHVPGAGAPSALSAFPSNERTRALKTRYRLINSRAYNDGERPCAGRRARCRRCGVSCRVVRARCPRVPRHYHEFAAALLKSETC
ncbi:hypothetical protein EVAR_26874_1 [Eumeta japonica]|uniref:Uncharacterized protein n=1 Tax=Eumeta variegata TaxID=151549 RepID=A0A4C1VVD5_EUMVA|nr:hypothetical protein EVAR_26874_1 [Eumeta japonica]